ncbi:hypothetical protein Ahy_B06g085771 isoform A [Arachis hypogaea]|uniref:PITH domain-containing protein n=2 Tax=Arachis hypogaea TaxID=3818 RepID=A0A444YVP4_ARAHY|nr:hypothetical protein Ahy_B06g085771 isoform A [Arachis hypogaea]
MSSLRRGVALIVFAPFVAIVVRPLSAVLLSYELLPRCSRRCFFSPRRRSKPSVESSGYCSWKFEALREMEKNEIEAALETSRKSLAANVLSSASQMSDPSKSFPEKEEVMELARKVFKDGRDVDLEDQVISDQFQIGYSSSRSSHFRSIPDCRYFSFICVSITGLKTCMTSGYSYIEGIEHLLLSLKQNNYEMHAFTNYPICCRFLKMGICNQDTIKQLQSMMENVNEQQKITFQDAWQCDICGSKSERGFEATFEVLPRLNDIKFGSGVIDELLFLELPREQRFPCVKIFGKQRGFTSNVKIKSISIVGGADGTSPAKMRAFINRDGIDFSDAQSMQAIQLGVLKKAGSPIQHVIQVVRKNDPLGRDVELFRRHYYAPGQVGPAFKDILLLTDRK